MPYSRPALSESKPLPTPGPPPPKRGIILRVEGLPANTVRRSIDDQHIRELQSLIRELQSLIPATTECHGPRWTLSRLALFCVLSGALYVGFWWLLADLFIRAAAR